MQHFEIGLNNQTLSWSEHLFSDILREIGDLSGLIWEPVFDTSGKSFFVVVPENEVRWNWSDWEYVEKTIRYGKKPMARSQIIKHPEKSSAKLNELANADTLEMIFYGEQGQTGAVKQRLSDKVYENNIRFEMRDKKFLVSVSAGLSTENLVVEKYGLFDTQKLRRVYTSKFGGGAETWVAGTPFGEYLVVVKQNGQKRKMLQCSAVGTRLTHANDEEREKLRVIIEDAQTPHQTSSPETTDWDEWLNNWCHISREKILSLVHIARSKLNLSEQEAKHFAQFYPTGLHRALVLHALDCPYFKSGWWKIESLDGDDFLTSVGNMKKGLAEILALMPTIEEKLWAIKEAENNCLPQVLKNVKDVRLPVLRRELHLLERRRNAVHDREEKRKAA